MSNGPLLKRAGVLCLTATMAAAQEPPPATFQSVTRLVEVEVVVRQPRVRPPGLGAWLAWTFDSGPPFGPPGETVKGLTKDDFTLLDQGKPQAISVFSTEPSSHGTSFDLLPGTVSNRSDSRGQPLKGPTAVLIDLLNTPWDLTEYARVGLKEFLRSLTLTDGGIALYALGGHLHVLHDFTDDPQKLRDAAAMLDQPRGKLPLEFASALGDYGDLLELSSPQAAAEVHGRITVQAVTRIIQHLAGVPGRKSLVWLAQAPRIPPALMTGMRQANIILYPVNVRGTGFADLESEATRIQGTASGGRGFGDARDLSFAVQTAEEDSHSAYVLGYYPSANMLDGTFHKIAVSLNKAKFPFTDYELHYRSGYLATKLAAPAPASTLTQLVEDPIASTAIGLAARATPQAQHPGLYDLVFTVDLHDIHLDRIDGHFIGAFDLTIPNSSNGTIKHGSVSVDLTDQQFAAGLESGLTQVVRGVEPESGDIHLVVRDRADGKAGSLLVPVPK